MAKSSIKTAFLGGFVNGQAGFAATAIEVVIDTWVSQDDIRIVAIEVGIVADPDDTQSNADGAIRAHCEVSRSGRVDQPGGLLKATVQSTWNGVVAIGGPTAVERTVNFPTGSGVDVDSGETLNLITSGLFVGAGTLDLYNYAILHYIER